MWTTVSRLRLGFTLMGLVTPSLVKSPTVHLVVNRMYVTIVREGTYGTDPTVWNVEQ